LLTAAPRFQGKQNWHVVVGVLGQVEMREKGVCHLRGMYGVFHGQRPPACTLILSMNLTQNDTALHECAIVRSANMLFANNCLAATAGYRPCWRVHVLFVLACLLTFLLQLEFESQLLTLPNTLRFASKQLCDLLLASLFSPHPFNASVAK
jgi:hypothetical protein